MTLFINLINKSFFTQLYLGLIVLGAPELSFCQSNGLDSLRLEHSKSSKSSQDITYLLFRKFVNTNNDSAMHYALKYEQLALMSGDSFQIAKAYHMVGDVAAELGNISFGIEKLEHSLQIANRNEFDERIRAVLNTLSILYTRVGRFDIALKYGLETLTLREQFGDRDEISRALNNIGLIYLEMEDYRNGNEYFDQAYKMKLDNGDPNVEIEIINMAYCQLGLGDLESAIRLFESAVETCGFGCERSVKMRCYLGLGTGLLKKGELDESNWYLTESLKLAEDHASIRHTLNGLTKLAELELIRDNVDQSYLYISKAKKLADDFDFVMERMDVLDMMSIILQAQGKFREASNLKSEYIEELEGMINGKLVGGMSDVLSAVNRKRNLSLIENHRKILSLQEESNRQLRFINVIGAFVLVLFAVLATLLWRASRLKGRINHLLNKRVKAHTQKLINHDGMMHRQATERAVVLRRLNNQLVASLATLSGLIQIAYSDIEDSVTRDQLKRMGDEARRLRLKRTSILTDQSVDKLTALSA